MVKDTYYDSDMASLYEALIKPTVVTTGKESYISTATSCLTATAYLGTVFFEEVTPTSMSYKIA